MITNDKKISTSEYWDSVYSGKRNDAKTDASNNIRPKDAFDRFQWVADLVEGPNVLGIASGHATIEKRIKAAHPDWNVVASDQAAEAQKVANFQPYLIIDAYAIPAIYREFKTLICAQALEYMEHQEKFLKEAWRVSEKLILTLPIGEMKLWSQLRIYTEENVKALLEPYGTIEVFERHDDLLVVKLKFSD